MPEKHCAVCGIDFTPKSAVAKYCPVCSKKVQREKSNESKRRSRERSRRVCIELSAKHDLLCKGGTAVHFILAHPAAGNDNDKPRR